MRTTGGIYEKVPLISFEQLYRLRSHMNDIVPLSYRSDFGTEKLTVDTGPVRYRTSFGTCLHGYGIVTFRSISRESKQKKV